MKEKNKMEHNLIDIKVKVEIEKKNYEETKKRLCQIENYKLLVDCLGTDGMVTQMLKISIIPKLEEVMNNILKVISKFTIKFNIIKTKSGIGCTEGIEIKKICNNDGMELNTQCMSGGENLLGNIALMLGLTHINSRLNTGFIFLDESFVYMDRSSVNNIGQIFNYLSDKYNTVMVISHNQDILNNFDNIIEVKNDGLFSHINV